MREAHVPTQQSEAQEDPRFPAPDADARRPRGAEVPAGSGPQAPVRLIWRVRDRATFDALGRVPVLRRNGVWLRSVRTDAPDSPPRVAYAVGRRLGDAVQRNRIRRRLREAVRAVRGELEPGRAYLLGARPDAATMPYRDLVSTLEHLLRSARESW
jgi:ribonuclease P protein component